MNPNPLMNPSGARLVLIVSAVAVAIAGIGTSIVLMKPNQPTPAETTNAAKAEENKDAIGALGRLEPAGEIYKVAAPATGFSSRIEKLLVKEGDKVKAGQPLAVMDNYPSLVAAARQAEAQLIEAQTRLDQVRAGAKQGDIRAQRAEVLQAGTDLERSRADLSTAELERQKAIFEANKWEAEFKKAEWDYERYSQLRKEEAISEAELKSRELNYITTKRQFDQAQKAVGQAEQTVQQRQQAIARANLAIAKEDQRLSSVAEVRPTDLKQAEAQVLVARTNFEKAKVELETAVVKSRIDGQVLVVHAKDGETVGTSGIMEVGRTDQMFVVAEVDENYIGKVALGNKARVKSDAFQGEISGTVTEIGRQVRQNAVTSADPAEKQDSRIVEVKIRLDDSKPVAGLTNLQVKVAINP
ncbi:biotin/lipoyl-binding protein [Alkalinema pantanalense CENA528]|uniref:HlyD family efflux transporter periplasmic adaptor subunit n=1 Tax=Alkalinema pantanalense TaxID=1620705 RepID=UPI003D6FCC1A